MKNLFLWREKVERERARRIKLAVAAYAYEIDDKSLMTDHEFDKECRMINPDLDTGNPLLDKFFREKFDPSTGMWIHDHPELDRIREVYLKYYKNPGGVKMIKWN